LPLIALAYLAFAAGLLTGFGGYAWVGVTIALVTLAASAFRRHATSFALAMLMASGALIGTIAERPQRARAPSGERKGVLDRAQQRASRSIDRLFGKDAPMARALLIADQHRIPPEMRDRYAKAGMVHMLSISGLHVAIVAGAVVMLLQALGLRRNAASIGSVVLTIVYVAIIGAPPPAVRSAAMLSVIAASRSLQRPASQWAALAIGAFMPLYTPRTILDLGYQLSVVGIAGLIGSAALSRRLLDRRLSGWQKKISKELLTSLVATAVTAPLITWYFGRLSLIAPVANLAAGPVISLLQPTLFLALALAPVEPAARIVAGAAHPMLVAFDGIATAAAAVPGASISVIPSLITVVIGGIASFAFLSAMVSRYPARPLIVGAASLTVIAWMPVIPHAYRGGMEMHMLDVGQGDAILVRSNRGRWIIFDAGRIWKSGDAGRSTIIPYIMSRGGDVEAFVLSHAHADHVGGAQSILQALHPRYFWDSAFPQGSGVYEATLEAAERSGTRWKRVHAGDTVRVDDVRVTFIAPDSSWTATLADPNEASTIALVEYGSTRFLLTGDAERAEEDWLINHAFDKLDVDVLKVGHHGSNTSSTDEFLKAVTPSLALISVGADNLYGHPSRDVLASLTRIGAQTVRTDQSGTIVVHSDGRSIYYEARGERWDISRQ
jgi:competence protein ComEC